MGQRVYTVCVCAQVVSLYMYMPYIHNTTIGEGVSAPCVHAERYHTWATHVKKVGEHRWGALAVESSSLPPLYMQ